MSFTFPTIEHYEVQAVRGGQVSPYARGGEFNLLEQAKKAAERYQAEADENYAMESRGPVKPIYVEYIVVRVIETREVV